MDQTNDDDKNFLAAIAGDIKGGAFERDLRRDLLAYAAASRAMRLASQAEPSPEDLAMAARIEARLVASGELRSPGASAPAAPRGVLERIARVLRPEVSATGHVPRWRPAVAAFAVAVLGLGVVLNVPVAPDSTPIVRSAPDHGDAQVVTVLATPQGDTCRDIRASLQALGSFDDLGIVNRMNEGGCDVEFATSDPGLQAAASKALRRFGIDITLRGPGVVEVREIPRSEPLWKNLYRKVKP